MKGKVITARGLIGPEELGCVLMHEHLYTDMYDWQNDIFVEDEKPIAPDRRKLLEQEAIPYLRQCRAHGCYTYVEATPAPWRPWPTFYEEASNAGDIHIILCTGFYREVEYGRYWVKKPEYSIWSFVRDATVEELAEFCTKEILEGIHGTKIRAGAIKLGSSTPEMTAAEKKAFLAGAQAQLATGVHITTHCTQFGVESTQLELLESAGVNLHRVVLGHTGNHLIDPERRKICIDWMKKGANFLVTNEVMWLANVQALERSQKLVNAIHEIFNAGLGGHVLFGSDGAFNTEAGEFKYGCMAAPPLACMFMDVLPKLREQGLTTDEEDMIMVKNPQAIIPVQ